jgi:GAF domain-containing protein
MAKQSRAWMLSVVPEFEGDDEKTRIARSLHVILLLVLVAGTLFSAFTLLGASQNPMYNVVLGVVMVLGSLALLGLLRFGHVQWASVLICVLLLGVVTAGVLAFGGIRGAVTMGYLPLILVAGLLLGWRGAVAFGLLDVMSASVAYFGETYGLIEASHVGVPVTDYLIVILTCGLMALVLSVTHRNATAGLARSRQTAAALAEQNRELQAICASLERYMTGLRAMTEVSRRITPVLDPDELVHQVVEVVRERFGLYYVGLFAVEEVDELVEERAAERQAFAVLRAGTGDAGRLMLERGHRLAVGSDSMIGQCAATGQARVELNVDRALLRYANPLLPATRSELALPLLSRERVIGAMTVQSTEPSAFDEQDIATLQTLADQVAATLDNARLYAEAQESVERSQRVMRRYVQESWDTLVETGATVSGYRYAAQQIGPDEDAWLSAMEDAVRAGEVVGLDSEADGASLAVPLVQNGVVIGVVGLRRPAGASWSTDERTLARSVAEQMTQALENRRLFQAAQERAQRESILRRTTDRVRSQADLDAAIRVAAQEMRRIVGATHVAIRLGAEDRLEPVGNRRMTRDGSSQQ